MPRIKLTKRAIDTLAIPKSDLVYWDVGLPGFGVQITPKGRKVFIVLYRAAGGRLREAFGRLPPEFDAPPCAAGIRNPSHSRK